MFKPKTPISGRLENSSGEWIRTTGLRVMRSKSFFSLMLLVKPDPYSHYYNPFSINCNLVE